MLFRIQMDSVVLKKRNGHIAMFGTGDDGDMIKMIV